MRCYFVYILDLRGMRGEENCLVGYVVVGVGRTTADSFDWFSTLSGGLRDGVGG